ncbi:hypothetical protein BDD12DRAFT_875686 [Trichophaea hybrida]|nr:hypothetical protein BDD12DRAFT_875686 [Trichophaea hybrida]
MKKWIQVLLSDSGMYQSSTESSQVATEDFTAHWESPGAPLEASEVTTEYSIAIQDATGDPKSHQKLRGGQRSTLRLHSPVPEDSWRFCRVPHSKSTSTTSGRSQGSGTGRLTLLMSFDAASIEVAISEERLDVYDSLCNPTFENSVNLVLGHADIFSQYETPQELNMPLVPFVLIGCNS